MASSRIQLATFYRFIWKCFQIFFPIFLSRRIYFSFSFWLVICAIFSFLSLLFSSFDSILLVGDWCDAFFGRFHHLLSFRFLSIFSTFSRTKKKHFFLFSPFRCWFSFARNNHCLVGRFNFQFAAKTIFGLLKRRKLNGK